MGCPESVKIGQRWRYHNIIIEAGINHKYQLHGKVVSRIATLSKSGGCLYPIGFTDYWVSDVTINYGINWEYLEGQDAPTTK